MRSGSKSSTSSKPALAAASSFSSSVPLRQTVAIERRIGPALKRPPPWSGDQLGDVLEHALAVGADAGEQLHRVGGLQRHHPGSGERPAAARPRVREQARLDRHVHDVGDPEPGTQQLGRHGRPGIRGHPGGRRVDQTVGCGEPAPERVGIARTRAPAAEPPPERLGELLGARGLDIGDRQLAGAEPEHRVGHGGAGATRAENDHPVAARRSRQAAPEGLPGNPSCRCCARPSGPRRTRRCSPR